ncbi:MAG: response regulator transcription factor [Ekhidna sp.]|nr:response regulator transcription factor [Ekhidna sp.]
MNPVILVVEDKPLLAEDLLDRLDTFGYSNILGPFKSAELAIQAIKDQEPDIAILDINLSGKMNGIALAKALIRIKQIPLIYLTHLEDLETLENSMQTQPVAFLNKPFTNSELRIAIQNAENQLDQETKSPYLIDATEKLTDRLFIRNGKGKIQIKLDDILWIQSGGGETSAVVVKERHHEGKLPYTVGFNLNKLEERLLFCPFIVRSSRFHMINLNNVKRIFSDSNSTKNKKILEIADQEFPLGEKYRKNVLDRFHLI